MGGMGSVLPTYDDWYDKQGWAKLKDTLLCSPILQDPCYFSGHGPADGSYGGPLISLPKWCCKSLFLWTCLFPFSVVVCVGNMKRRRRERREWKQYQRQEQRRKALAKEGN